MKNDVKDWLPSRFSETQEMEWFWEHFAGERFIIATWPGCTGDEDDEVFHLFKKKLAPTIPPSKKDVVFPEPLSKDVGATWLDRPYAFIGDRLGLHTVKNDHFDWGGAREKWLRGFEGRWYYITEAGDLYEFQGSDAPVVVAYRAVVRALGFQQLAGKRLVSFGPVDGPWYYSDPNRLQAQLFRSVVTGPDMLRDLTGEGGRLRDNEQEAIKRLKGSLLGPDGKQTAMVMTLSEAGLRDFHRVLSRGVLGKELGLLYKIAGQCGLSVDELHLGGPPVDNVAIDEEGTITLVRLVSLCVVLGIGLSYLCFRSWLATIAVFLTGGISAAMAMAFVGWSGTSADAVMMSMPALVYVLGISGAVHFINYYREAVDEHGLIGGPERALGHAWKPALLCNITTAIGLLSLYTSEIVPIKKFGLFAALGVMGTLLLILTYLPSALQIWPLNLPKHKQREDGADSMLDSALGGFWERFGTWIIDHYRLVAITCTLVIACVGYGVRYINTSVNLLDLFDKNAKLLRDYAWIENHLGMLVPMEVVVKIAPEAMRHPAAEDAPDGAPNRADRYRMTFLERVETVAAVQREIDSHFGERGARVVGRTMSAVTFSPPLPSPTAKFHVRSGLNSGLKAHRADFLRSDYLAIDKADQSELWRISLRVAAFKGVDYGEFVRDLRTIVEPVMAARNAWHRLLQSIVEQRSREPEASDRPGFFQVAIVLPDGVFEALKADAARQRINAPEGKSGQAAGADQAADGGRPPPSAPVELQVVRDAVFARTLDAGLRASNTVVRYFPVSVLEANVEKLPAFDRIVTVGRIPDAVTALLPRNPEVVFDARRFLAENDKGQPESAVASGRPAEAISAVYTGVVPIVYKAQRTLLESLMESTAWAFLTITPLMMLVSRSVWAGLLAMLPNALPVLLIFGAMGWAGIRVDIGSMMTASIALGVAVDDTIHYLTWFRSELDRLGDRRLAILAAYRRCATPTFQAAMISGLGLSIFAFSTFTPTQRFGYLMLTILFAGVVAELVFYPALLASPLGAVVKPRTKRRPPEDDDPELDPPAIVPLGSKSGRKPTTKRIAFLLLCTRYMLGVFKRTAS